MRAYTLLLTLALLAAASSIATVTVPTSAIAQKSKGTVPQAAPIPPTEPGDDETAMSAGGKKKQAAAGKCGTNMYYNKKTGKCADAAAKKGK